MSETIKESANAAQVPLFGTAGLSESFRARGYKSMLDAAAYTASFGLTAFEFQAGRGVRLPAQRAEALRQQAAQAGFCYSLHAPYYISMSGMEEEKRLGSLRYFLQSARAVRQLGGNRVIFHAGSAGKQPRDEALKKAKDTLARALEMLDEEGYADIHLCPETMGKVGQLGTLEEVLALCGVDRRVIPCLDFGHLNARSQGAIRGREDYAAILNQVADALPDERARNFHVHFSKIEYTEGGEKRHLTFKDCVFGPAYEPLLELCWERQLTPVFICESSGTQAEDAAEMMKFYKKLSGGN